MISEPSNLMQLGFVAKTNPAAETLSLNTVTRAAERKLNLVRRAEWLELMISQSANDIEARTSFESDLANLRSLYRTILPDEVIQTRCRKLAELKASLNMRITDNRQACSRQTTRAVNALCGGANV